MFSRRVRSRNVHAGNSVWADSRWSYVDLNISFLGVAFEARMQDEQPINEAQLHSARSLTEMLYAIAVAAVRPAMTK